MIACNNSTIDKETPEISEQENPSEIEQSVSTNFIGQTYSRKANDSFGNTTETFSFKENGQGNFVVGWTVYSKYHEDYGTFSWKIIDGEIHVYYTYHASDGVVSHEERAYKYDEGKNKLFSTEYDSEVFSCVSSSSKSENISESNSDNEYEDYYGDEPPVPLDESPEEYFESSWREGERHYISKDRSEMYQISTDIENENNLIIDYAAFGDGWSSESRKFTKKGNIITIKVDDLIFSEYWDNRLEVKDITSGEIKMFDVWYRPRNY